MERCCASVHALSVLITSSAARMRGVIVGLGVSATSCAPAVAPHARSSAPVRNRMWSSLELGSGKRLTEVHGSRLERYHHVAPGDNPKLLDRAGGQRGNDGGSCG